MIKKGELKKYVKNKVPMKPGTPLPWKNQGQIKTEQVGTSKNGDWGKV